MRRVIVMSAGLVLVEAAILLAANPYQWGGRGYDPALKKRGSSRYSIHESYGTAKSTIEILVDARETVKEVGQMRLKMSDGQEVVSTECWKAMKHLDAPWACTFERSGIKLFSGQGRMIIENRAGDLLIEDVIDFDRLNAFIRETVLAE